MKRNLLLLHAALGTKEQFAPIKEELSEAFNCYDLNFEGHGGRKTDQPYSIERFTENTLVFIRENYLNQVNIFGYSMGGFVGLNLALKHPQLVGKIATLGTKFDWNKESTVREVGFLNPEKIKEKIPHYAQKLAADHAPLDWEQVMHKTAEMMLNLSEGKDVNCQKFAAIQHQVTIGIGSEDKMVTQAESKQIADLLPNGKLQVMDGMPHPIDKIDSKQLINYIESALSD